MEFAVRPANLSDADVIVDFNARLAQETEHLTLDPALLALGVQAVLADPAKGRYWLAQTDGRIIGQISLTYEWSDWRNGWFWWIQSVYVLAEYRRLGVFRASTGTGGDERGGPAIVCREREPCCPGRLRKPRNDDDPFSDYAAPAVVM